MRSNIEKQEVPNCPICLSTLARFKFRVREHEYDTSTDDWFSLVECTSCKAWYLNPRPHVSTLSTIYPPNYYAYRGQTAAGGNLNEKIAEKLFRSRFDPIAKHQKLDTNTSWLELGCGQGEVLEGLKKYYGMNSLLGVDYSQSSVEICKRKGFETICCRLEELEIPEGQQFDIVNSVHLIEHVVSPYEYMQKGYSFLKPGGLCVFTTPNKATWEARMLNRHWGGLHAPRHWSLMDHNSVRILGEKTGFEFVEVFSTRSGIFWNWSCHSLCQSLLGRNIADFLFPSDDRSNSTSRFNVIRIGAGAVLDILNSKLWGQSSTMVAIFRKSVHKPKK